MLFPFWKSSLLSGPYRARLLCLASIVIMLRTKWGTSFGLLYLFLVQASSKLSYWHSSWLQSCSRNWFLDTFSVSPLRGGTSKIIRGITEMKFLSGASSDGLTCLLLHHFPICQRTNMSKSDNLFVLDRNNIDRMSQFNWALRIRITALPLRRYQRYLKWLMLPAHGYQIPQKPWCFASPVLSLQIQRP